MDRRGDGVPRPVHGLRHAVRLRRVPRRARRGVRLEPRQPLGRVLPVRLRVLGIRPGRRPPHRPVGSARGHRNRGSAARYRADTDEPGHRAVAALSALRNPGGARHVDRLRALQRHRREVVHAPTRHRGRPGQRGRAYGDASTLFSATVTDFFGREHAASLAGLLFSLSGSMAACGPFAAGFIYDRTGNYRLAWWLSAACNGLALSLLAFTRPPARRDETGTAAA